MNIGNVAVINDLLVIFYISALSRFCLAVTQGMIVFNKAFADPCVVKDVVKVAISFRHESCQTNKKTKTN